MSRRVPAPRWAVLAVMCVGYFLVLLDVTVVNVALPRLGVDLGSRVEGLQWVVDGYSLALASLLLAGGSIGDLLGHKPVVMTGLLVFGVASLACGGAPSTGFLVAGRVVQGAGAALLLPGTLAIISDAFPGRGEQARAIGVWAGVGSLALPAGPLLGGLLVQGPGWRWVFWANVPVVLLAALVAARVVHPDVAHAGSGTGLGRLDVAGTLLAALTLAALVLGVIRAGRAGLDGGVSVAVVVGGLALLGFLLAERRAPSPMLPLGLFRRPAFSTANAVAGAMNLGTLGLLFLLTMFLQVVQHRSALAAGVAVLPLFVPLAVLAPVAGRVAARTGPAAPMVAGLLLAAVGVGLLATWSVSSAYADLVPALLAWGVGIAVLTPAVVAASVAAAPADRSGLASGVNNTARQAGGAVGIAVYGAVAGQPSGSYAHFLAGLHVTGLATAALYVAAAAVTVCSRTGR
jgi:MFS transporter, DHA2 family, methylenomycin A resistance protein